MVPSYDQKRYCQRLCELTMHERLNVLLGGYRRAHLKQVAQVGVVQKRRIRKLSTKKVSPLFSRIPLVFLICSFIFPFKGLKKVSLFFFVARFLILIPPVFLLKCRVLVVFVFIFMKSLISRSITQLFNKWFEGPGRLNSSGRLGGSQTTSWYRVMTKRTTRQRLDKLRLFQRGRKASCLAVDIFAERCLMAEGFLTSCRVKPIDQLFNRFSNDPLVACRCLRMSKRRTQACSPYAPVTQLILTLKYALRSNLNTRGVNTREVLYVC